MSRIGKLKKYFSNKSVLILGFGTEGQSSLDFLSNNFPETRITVYDKNLTRLGRNVRFITGSIDTIEDKFDLILKSPGIPLSDDFVSKYKNIISSQTDLFLREFHLQTIGITGTKGKSTTASLLHSILISCGKRSVLAGNIGVPVFDIIDSIDDNSIIVLELSSHQLQFIKQAPHISAILNVYPEHLDFYKNFIEYRSAKMNIVKMQNEDDHIIFPIKEFTGLERRSVSEPFEIIIDGDDILVYYSRKTIVLNQKCIELKGNHNLYNIGTALIAADLAGCDTNDAVKAAGEFKGLEHRLEYFGTYKGVEFYNDSISTIPQASVAAIKAFNNRIGSLILGGHFRGEEISWRILTDEIKKSFVDNIFFLPDTGSMIYNDMLSAGFEEKERDGYKEILWNGNTIRCFFCKDFRTMVVQIFKFTHAGKICLLSPASSSYNMFKNFEERGMVFKELVMNYGGNSDKI
ncbi:MAG TPA: UDP-N-acetylmuramoyl-L-alanine--D-glutamate ligase [Clostridiales bacterium]|nr:UDP-N-acetylmuramoyl-L-alanine--D-glutamate ligase [Clostridiales bacterium]